jgi:hypothetical protein
MVYYLKFITLLFWRKKIFKDLIFGLIIFYAFGSIVEQSVLLIGLAVFYCLTFSVSIIASDKDLINVYKFYNVNTNLVLLVKFLYLVLYYSLTYTVYSLL